MMVRSIRVNAMARENTQDQLTKMASTCTKANSKKG